ncbi:MAG: translation initiation factor IF-3 [Patescibacteria group bacterium]
MKHRVRINQEIRAQELRVIDDEDGNLGVLTLNQALDIAEDRGLDLIEISPEAVPPVAKIMEYGKWQYIQDRKAREARSKTHVTETKALQVKIGTGDHDLEMKAKKASEFLKDGHRVKINLFLPGRSKYLDPRFLQERLDRMLRLVSENYKVAEPPQKSPKGLTVVIERDRAKKAEGEPDKA